MADLPLYPGTPRWVKVSGIVVAALVLLVFIIVIVGGGRHGPARHLSSSDAGPHIPGVRAAAEVHTVAGQGLERVSIELGRL